MWQNGYQTFGHFQKEKKKVTDVKVTCLCDEMIIII